MQAKTVQASQGLTQWRCDCFFLVTRVSFPCSKEDRGSYCGCPGLMNQAKGRGALVFPPTTTNPFLTTFESIL